MRVLHLDDNLQSVGITIDPEATYITEFEFLKLEREWDELTSSIFKTNADRKKQKQQALQMLSLGGSTSMKVNNQLSPSASLLRPNNKISGHNNNNNSRKSSVASRASSNGKASSGSRRKSGSRRLDSSSALSSMNSSSDDDDDDDDDDALLAEISTRPTAPLINTTSNHGDQQQQHQQQHLPAFDHQRNLDIPSVVDKAVKHANLQASTSPLRFYEVTTEQIGRVLEPVSITDIIDRNFAGVELTRDLMNKVIYASKPVTSYLPSIQHRVNAVSKKNQPNANKIEHVTFHEFLYALYPKVPALNIDRFFMTYVTEELLLSLKGSLGIPPYVRFAPSSKPTALGTFAHTKDPRTSVAAINNSKEAIKRRKAAMQGGGGGGGGGKKSGGSNNNNNNKKTTVAMSMSMMENGNSDNNFHYASSASRLEVFGPSFEEMTGAIGGRLDLATLAANNFCMGQLLFPEQLFEAVTSRFAPRSTDPRDVDGWRASFFECLRMMFPRVPETLLKCYEITTPTVPQLQGIRDIFILRNPSAFASFESPNNSNNNNNDQSNNNNNTNDPNHSNDKSKSAATQNGKQQSPPSKESKFSPVARDSALTKTAKGGLADDGSSEEERNKKLLEMALAKQAKKNTANPFLPQVLPSGTVQCVGGEPCKPVQDMIKRILNSNSSASNENNNANNNNNNNANSNGANEKVGNKKVSAQNKKNAINKTSDQQQQATQNDANNENANVPVVTKFPADRQWLALNDYKSLIFETKKYSELTLGVPLTYQVFVTIDRSFKVDTVDGAAATTSSKQRRTGRNQTQQQQRISLASAIRFLFPNAPLPLFMAYLDRMEQVLGAPQKSFVIGGTGKQQQPSQQQQTANATSNAPPTVADLQTHKFVSIREQQRQQDEMNRVQRRQRAIESLLTLGSSPTSSFENTSVSAQATSRQQQHGRQGNVTASPSNNDSSPSLRSLEERVRQETLTSLKFSSPSPPKSANPYASATSPRSAIMFGRNNNNNNQYQQPGGDDDDDNGGGGGAGLVTLPGNSSAGDQPNNGSSFESNNDDGHGRRKSPPPPPSSTVVALLPRSTEAQRIEEHKMKMIFGSHQKDQKGNNNNNNGNNARLNSAQQQQSKGRASNNSAGSPASLKSASNSGATSSATTTHQQPRSFFEIQNALLFRNPQIKFSDRDQKQQHQHDDEDDNNSNNNNNSFTNRNNMSTSSYVSAAVGGGVSRLHSGINDEYENGMSPHHQRQQGSNGYNNQRASTARIISGSGGGARGNSGDGSNNNNNNNDKNLLLERLTSPMTASFNERTSPSPNTRNKKDGASSSSSSALLFKPSSSGSGNRQMKRTDSTLQARRQSVVEDPGKTLFTNSRRQLSLQTTMFSGSVSGTRRTTPTLPLNNNIDNNNNNNNNNAVSPTFTLPSKLHEGVVGNNDNNSFTGLQNQQQHFISNSSFGGEEQQNWYNNNNNKSKTILSKSHYNTKQQQNEQKQQEKAFLDELATTPKMTRLGNGLYSTKDIAQDFAILDAHEKALQAERQKREKVNSKNRGRSNNNNNNNKKSNGSEATNIAGQAVDEKKEKEQNHQQQQQQKQQQHLHDPDYNQRGELGFDDSSDDEDFASNAPSSLGIPRLHQHQALESVSVAVLRNYYQYTQLVENETDRKTLIKSAKQEVKDKLIQQMQQHENENDDDDENNRGEHNRNNANDPERKRSQARGGGAADLSRSSRGGRRPTTTTTTLSSSKVVGGRRQSPNSQRSPSRNVSPSSSVRRQSSVSPNRRGGGKGLQQSSPASSARRGTTMFASSLMSPGATNSSSSVAGVGGAGSPTTTMMMTHLGNAAHLTGSASPNGTQHSNNSNNILSTVLNPEQLDRMLIEMFGSKEQAQFVIDSLKKRAQSTPLPPQVLAMVNAMAAAEVEKAEKLKQQEQKKLEQMKSDKRASGGGKSSVKKK